MSGHVEMVLGLWFVSYVFFSITGPWHHLRAFYAFNSLLLPWALHKSATRNGERFSAVHSNHANNFQRQSRSWNLFMRQIPFPFQVCLSALSHGRKSPSLCEVFDALGPNIHPFKFRHKVFATFANSAQEYEWQRAVDHNASGWITLSQFSSGLIHNIN